MRPLHVIVIPLFAAILSILVVPLRARAEPPGWAASVAGEVKAGKPIVLHVTVPLCSNDQIDCGSSIAGKPGELEHNVYWGAAFGSRRFFERKRSGWERVEVKRGSGPRLERVVFRKEMPGAPWGRAQPIEVIVVAQAFHGASIDEAVTSFYALATQGGTVSFDDRGKERTERVSVAGYAGHNRLMDGLKLPKATSPSPSKTAIPSFVLACISEAYFGEALRRAGSETLVMTRSFMAPEAYLLDAIATGLGGGEPNKELRARAVKAYATWQKLTGPQASSVFAK